MMGPHKREFEPIEEVKQLSALERIEYIEDTEPLVSFPEYDAVTKQLNKKLRKSSPDAADMFLFTGLTGMGKSTILKEFAAQNDWYEINRRDRLPVLYVTLPANATPTAIQERMLFLLREPSTKRISNAKLTETLFWNIRRLNVGLIIFDELQHLEGTVANKQYRIALNFFKDIVVYAGVPVVLSGLKYAVENIHAKDTQIRRRAGDIFYIHGWRYSEKLADFLEAYEQTLPLQQYSNLSDDAMVAAVARYCDGTTHDICKKIRDAAIFELGRGNEKISPTSFSSMGLKPIKNMDYGSDRA